MMGQNEVNINSIPRKMIISINFFPLIHYFSSKIADTMSKWEFLYFSINCDGDLSSYGLTEYNLIDLTSVIDEV